MSLVVIIPAAGSGSRFGGELPKQFQSLGGRPVLERVIERFLREDEVTAIVVPIAEELVAAVSLQAGERIRFVAGGETRQQSVMRGLAQIDAADLVAIHDAARPLFSASLQHSVVEAAREVGAALPVVTVTDTIHVMNDDATVASTLDRSILGAAQTPQCFRIDILRRVLERATAQGIEGTDEAGLAARFGFIVKAVPGDPRNVKITVPDDLLIAEAYLREEGRS
jgi:2-C-methyl-D-erythritol 4-phosphate cytidylyltransferase/2-C-methyl-D-erythritol 4-phosphate cytidylyltransferase/2-C-methyl-D-erythritol 2,4-cyclodiphosphate synthase